jgi:hypothetical protein
MTGLIFNPGSKIGAMTGAGWTNTVETARAMAVQLLAEMHEEGMTEVVLLPGEEEHEHRWRFHFRHSVTGIEVVLETHGVDDVPAYEREHIFPPRVHWGGSSTAIPSIEDFAAPGFRVHQTFVPSDTP